MKRRESDMNKNKRLLVIVLIALVGLAPLLATQYGGHDNEEYEQTTQPFMGTNIRSLSMGGAGLGMKGYSESFLLNPANLPGSGFKLTMPAVTVTAYNVVETLKSPMIDYLASDDDNEKIKAAEEFLKTIRRGHGDVLTTDVSLLTLNAGGFGLSIQAQERLMSFKKSKDSDFINLIAQATAAATLGFGFNIPIIPKWFDIDLGASVQFAYKAYLEKVGADTIVNMMGDDSSDPATFFLNETPLIAGWSMPITIGMNVNGPFGLSLSAAARNINATQHMIAYASVDDWALENFGQSLSGAEGPAKATIEEFEVVPEFRFDLGLTWSQAFGGSLLTPTISLDVIDAGKLAGKQGDDLTRAFLESTRVGASLRVLNILDLRYGLNRGYHSVGLGLDLFVFHVDVAYYTLQYGESLGKGPIDALSVRIGLLSR